MPDYNNAKIYKIEGVDSKGELLTYYGSTTQSLAVRLAAHVRDSKTRRDCTSKIVIDNNEYKIILVETYPCKSKEELVAREYFYIQNNNCVNYCKFMNRKCPHNKRGCRCRLCKGGSICQHDKRRDQCKQCKQYKMQQLAMISL